MDEKEFITKIQLLKEIKPSEDWVLSCRARMAFRLEMDRKKNILNKDVFILRELFAFWGNIQQKSSFNWAYSLAVALIVIIGGGVLIVWASGQAMPGSPLYPVKLAIERVRVSVSLSEESRLQLQTQLADARLRELTDVINSQDTNDQKIAKVSQVAESIQNQLTTINNQLPKIGVRTEPQKATAKMVSDKASQASKTLAAAKEMLPDSIKADLNTKLAEVTEAVDKVGITALEAMIANQDAGVKKEEIALKLEEEIKKTEEQFKIKEKEMVQNDSFADKSPIRAVLINQFEQGLDLLDKAKDALAEDNFKGALEMLKAAKAIDSGTDKMTQNTVIPVVQEEASSTTTDLVK